MGTVLFVFFPVNVSFVVFGGESCERTNSATVWFENLCTIVFVGLQVVVVVLLGRAMDFTVVAEYASSWSACYCDSVLPALNCFLDGDPGDSNGRTIADTLNCPGLVVIVGVSNLSALFRRWGNLCLTSRHRW